MNEAIATKAMENLRARVAGLEAERDDARTQLAAFVLPGALSPGETPALCGTCTERLCVPGLPGCAHCTAAEVEGLRTQYRDLMTRAKEIERQRDHLHEQRGVARSLQKKAERQRGEALADVDRVRADVRELAVLRRDMGAVQGERDAYAEDAGTAWEEARLMRRDRDILAHRAVRLWGAWQSARRGRAIARTELWQMTAARDVFVTFTKEAETERDRLAEQVKRVLESAHWALTTSADDWSVTFGKAWLYGMFVGWCCEEAHEHDEICGGAHDTLGDLARRGAWPPAAIERLRVLRSDVRALDGTEATP